jgi:hypothetical protein
LSIASMSMAGIVAWNPQRAVIRFAVRVIVNFQHRKRDREQGFGRVERCKGNGFV